jgi:hypothetical protein
MHIGLPRHHKQVLPSAATQLAPSTRLLLLLMHVNKAGVPLFWRKKDVPGWQFDEPERIVSLTRILSAFIGQRRYMVVILMSCGLSGAQLKELQRLARKRKCIFVVNIRQSVLYLDAKDPLLSEYMRLAVELLRQSVTASARENGVLSVQQVLEAARCILQSSAPCDTAASSIIVGGDGSTTLVRPTVTPSAIDSGFGSVAAAPSTFPLTSTLQPSPATQSSPATGSLSTSPNGSAPMECDHSVPLVATASSTMTPMSSTSPSSSSSPSSSDASPSLPTSKSVRVARSASIGQLHGLTASSV